MKQRFSSLDVKVCFPSWVYSVAHKLTRLGYYPRARLGGSQSASIQHLRSLVGTSSNPTLLLRQHLTWHCITENLPLQARQTRPPQTTNHRLRLPLPCHAILTNNSNNTLPLRNPSPQSPEIAPRDLRPTNRHRPHHRLLLQ